MRVFISWSGELSKAVAVILRDWLPSVIQVLDPFMSEEDIDSGTRWVNSLGRELQESSVGVLCVTRGNLNAPWLNFEAGALSKALDESRVIPLLIDLRKSDLSGPLSQFQAEIIKKETVKRVIHALNSHVGESRVRPEVLNRSFEHGWPELERQLGQVIEDHSGGEPQGPLRDTPEILEEILELLRSQQRMLETAQKPDPQYSRPVSEKEFETNITSKLQSLVDEGHVEVEYGGRGQPWDFMLRLQGPAPKTIIGEIVVTGQKSPAISPTLLRNLASMVLMEGADEGVVITNNRPRQSSFHLAEQLSTKVAPVDIMSAETLVTYVEALVVRQSKTHPSVEVDDFDDDDLDDVPF